VHDGFWHVGLNMLAVWMIGRSLEPLLGHARFLALYLISGLGGSVAVALLAFGTPVIGASGAVFGLLGALLVIGRHIGANITAIAILLGINLVIGFLPGRGISWQAHVGGLVTGALIGLIYARTRTRRLRALQILLLAALVAALGALLLVPLAIYG
jgi:membrane associated rhomboid family serine protease